MDYSDEYEQYLVKELTLCDSQSAFCQEMASLALSEMTRLQRRQEQLVADLERLQQMRELFLIRASFPMKVSLLYTEQYKNAK